MTTTAIRFHGRGDIRVERLEEPKCGSKEVKMRPAYAGICGTDLHEYQSGPVLIPENKHPITHEKWPITMGHEFGGTIEEVGEDVKGLYPGQRAVVRPTIFDRICTACKSGCEQCCGNIGFIGLSGYGGGMAQYIVAPSEHFYPLPDNISFEIAALIEPLAVAWHAVNLSPFKLNDSALVLGGGPIGVGVVQILRLRGAKNIIVVELLDKRKDLVKDFGATCILDPREVDIPSEVHSITDDKGADVIFDTAGVEVALNGAIPACKVHGTIVNIAVWGNRPALDVNDLMYHEVNYVGAALYDEDSFKGVIKALELGQLNPEKMISAKVELNHTVDQGFRELIDHREKHCKILVDIQSQKNR